MLSTRRYIPALIVLLFLLGIFGIAISPAQADPLDRQEITSTPPFFLSSVTATVKQDDQDEVNLRGGPGTDYPLVGKLRAGDTVPALGRSPGGDWVLISYPSAPGNVAWIYAYLVTISGMLPVAEPPATPTPFMTPTIDPTLAAQFIREVPPTRLPTFTPPPPLTLPTFQPVSTVSEQGNMVMAYLIIGLSGFGLFGILLSFARSRR